MSAITSPSSSRIVAQLVAAASPLQVILFGSAARGEQRPDSDLDLMVVVPAAPPRRKLPLEGELRLAVTSCVPLDMSG